VRVTGDYLRDFDATLLLRPYTRIPNPITWVSYNQYTWSINGLLKDTIGQRDLPAVVLFDTEQVPDGSSILHYAPAYRYRVVEFWDWSSNFATVDDSKERVIFLYPDGYRPLAPVEIYLGDYLDLSNGVWRISQ
jgi:hypothetical protein